MFGGGVGVGGGGGGSGGGGRENENRALMSHMMMPLPPLQHNPSADDDEFPKRDERVPQWTHQETRDFISIRAELERDFTAAKRNKTLWEVVSGRMKEFGYRRSADQCKCKWKNLVNRYKGKETSDQDSGRHCPFFDELHAVFTDRETKMQRMLLESESGSKRGKRISEDQSSEELSDDEYEETYSHDQKPTRPKKRKVDKEKALLQSAERSSKQPSTGNAKTGNSPSSVQKMLQEFLQQQQRMEMMWRESTERHAYERQVFEQEWRQTMVKLERERMMVEQAWREREDQRRIREESRAEKRDALLTMLVNKLIQENHLS